MPYFQKILFKETSYGWCVKNIYKMYLTKYSYKEISKIKKYPKKLVKIDKRFDQTLHQSSCISGK